MRRLGGTPVEPLTAATLRSINLGRLIDAILDEAGPDLRRLAGIQRRFGVINGDMKRAGLGPFAGRRKRPGPKPLLRAHYEEVAQVYLATPITPTKAVADHFTVSTSTAAKTSLALGS